MGIVFGNTSILSLRTTPQIEAHKAATMEGRAGKLLNAVAMAGMVRKGAIQNLNKWAIGPHDLDFRGTGKTLRDALNAAFEKTGLSKSDFYITKWGRDANGKSFPVE